jgi:hypothetical protein
VDERGDLVADPALVVAVAARPLLQRHVVGPPAPGIRTVDAVDLHAPLVDKLTDGADHPAVLPVPALSELGGKHEQRPAPVAVRE